MSSKCESQECRCEEAHGFDSDTATNYLKGVFLMVSMASTFFGVCGLVAPVSVLQVMGYHPNSDPMLLSLLSSGYLAFGIISLLGVFNPIRFAPLLLALTAQDLIWGISYFIPQWVSADSAAKPSLPIHAAVFLPLSLMSLIVLAPFRGILRPTPTIELRKSHEA